MHNPIQVISVGPNPIDPCPYKKMKRCQECTFTEERSYQHTQRDGCLQAPVQTLDTPVPWPAAHLRPGLLQEEGGSRCRHQDSQHLGSSPSVPATNCSPVPTGSHVPHSPPALAPQRRLSLGPPLTSFSTFNHWAFVIPTRL